MFYSPLVVFCCFITVALLGVIWSRCWLFFLSSSVKHLGCICCIKTFYDCYLPCIKLWKSSHVNRKLRIPYIEAASRITAHSNRWKVYPNQIVRPAKLHAFYLQVHRTILIIKVFSPLSRNQWPGNQSGTIYSTGRHNHDFMVSEHQRVRGQRRSEEDLFCQRKQSNPPTTHGAKGDRWILPAACSTAGSQFQRGKTATLKSKLPIKNSKIHLLLRKQINPSYWPGLDACTRKSWFHYCNMSNEQCQTCRTELNWMSTLFDGIIVITITKTYSYWCQGNKHMNI